jgi:hypothetical protein
MQLRVQKEVIFRKRTKSNNQKELHNGGAVSTNAIARDGASNRLTVSKGFDRRHSTSEARAPLLATRILHATNILHEHLAFFAKRCNACF